MKETKGCAFIFPEEIGKTIKWLDDFLLAHCKIKSLLGNFELLFSNKQNIAIFLQLHEIYSIFYELSSDYPSVITLSSPCRNISNERKTLKNSSGNDHKNSMIAWKKDFNILTKFIGKIDLTIRDRGTNSIFVLFQRNQIVFFREADIS